MSGNDPVLVRAIDQQEDGTYDMVLRTAAPVGIEATFWKGRYDVQHRKVHDMEDVIAGLRWRLLSVERALCEVDAHHDISPGAVKFIEDALDADLSAHENAHAPQLTPRKPPSTAT